MSGALNSVLFDSVTSGVSNHLDLNSRPGAATTIVLNFYGITSDVTPFQGPLPRFKTDRGTDGGDWTAQELETIAAIHRTVSEQFRAWDINVTTNPAVVLSAVPPDRAVRCTIVNNSQPTSPVNGNFAISPINCVARIASLAFVGFALPEYPELPAEYFQKVAAFVAVVHEIGHCFGMRHKSNYRLDGTVAAVYGTGPYKLLSDSPDNVYPADRYKAVPVMGTVGNAGFSSGNSAYRGRRNVWFSGYAEGTGRFQVEPETKLLAFEPFSGASVIAEADQVRTAASTNATTSVATGTIAHPGGALIVPVSVTASGTLSVNLRPEIWSQLDYTYSLYNPAGTVVLSSTTTRYATDDVSTTYDTPIGNGRVTVSNSVTPGLYVMVARSFGREHDRGSMTVTMSGVAHVAATNSRTSALLIGAYVERKAQGARARLIFDRSITPASTSATNRSSWLAISGKRFDLDGSLSYSGNVADVFLEEDHVTDTVSADTASVTAADWGVAAVTVVSDAHLRLEPFVGLSAMSGGALVQDAFGIVLKTASFTGSYILNAPLFRLLPLAEVYVTSPTGTTTSVYTPTLVSNTLTASTFVPASPPGTELSVVFTAKDILRNTVTTGPYSMTYNGVAWIQAVLSVSQEPGVAVLDFVLNAPVVPGIVQDPFFSLLRTGSEGTLGTYESIILGQGPDENTLRVTLTYDVESSPTFPHDQWSTGLSTGLLSPSVGGYFVQTPFSGNIKFHRVVSCRYVQGGLEEGGALYFVFIELTFDADYDISQGNDVAGAFGLAYFGYSRENVTDYFGILTETSQTGPRTILLKYVADPSQPLPQLPYMTLDPYEYLDFVDGRDLYVPILFIEGSPGAPTPQGLGFPGLLGLPAGYAQVIEEVDENAPLVVLQVEVP
jgi:hypothetical protein